MAIAYDNFGEKHTVSGTTHTLSFTVGGGSDRFLVVAVLTNNASQDIVSGVTYNGTSMTSVAEYQTTNQNIRIYHYVLHNPDSGTHDVVVTTTTSEYCDYYVTSYTGVNQASSVDATDTQTGTGDETISITTTADNCWLNSIARNSDYGPMTASTGVTRRSSAGPASAGDSNGPKTPAGSQSLTWTAPSGDSFIQTIAIAPAGVGSTPYQRRSNLALMGVS